MNEDILNLKNTAEYYRDLYRMGKITREEAKIKIMPYLDAVNEKSKELCIKYNRKHKQISFVSYVR